MVVLPMHVRAFVRRDYYPVWQAMQTVTALRTQSSADELWQVEHPPIYTQGMNGKSEHLLDRGGTPLLQTDRGGQITYHGPGQIVMYTLIDLRRRGWGVRKLVNFLERSVIDTLTSYGIPSQTRGDAPGVYVRDRKIAAIGLRVRNGCSYHGVSLNVAMDLEPFQSINPCGYPGLKITQVSDEGGPTDLATVTEALSIRLQGRFRFTEEDEH